MLTVDLGNSRLKACRWSPEGEPVPLGSWEGTWEQQEAFESWLREAPPRFAALSSVGRPERAEELAAGLRARGVRVVLHPEPGVENRCREPERVGKDRLYAAAGAALAVGRSALIVDAGTALTVDALRIEGRSHAFLGGAIAPGPALLSQALAQGTAGLPRVEPRPGGAALGRVTEEAIEAGIAVGFRGAARELVEEIAREAELGEAPVVLTGGARSFLVLPRPFTTRVLEVVPDLIHRGLLDALVRTRIALGGR